jgi:hypothetical protein
MTDLFILMVSSELVFVFLTPLISSDGQKFLVIVAELPARKPLTLQDAALERKVLATLPVLGLL